MNAVTLRFNLQQPYSGDNSVVPRMQLDADIEAVYSMTALNSGDYHFEFSMAKAGEARVTINGQQVVISRSDRPEPLLKQDRYWVDYSPPENAQAHFSGALVRGKNEISVSYPQLLGKIQIDRRIFSKNTWVSALAYDLWPLREWALADDFHLDITVLVEDDRSLLGRIFSDPNRSISVVAQVEDEDLGGSLRSDDVPPVDWRPRPAQAIMGSDLVFTEGFLVRRYEIGKTLPRRIFPVAREH